MKKLLSIFLITLTFHAFSQEKSISGSVKDETGTPLLGVTILIKGVAKGTVTDFDGNFSLKAKPSDILVFSYLGTETKEVAVGDQTTINVSLTKSDTTLEEIVVVGYGSVKKSDLTGSVSSIKAEEITKVGAVGLDQALAGRAAGVIVRQSSGQPGAGASITIRGIGSFSGSQPLYVIDGIPLDNDSQSTLNSENESSASLNPLSMINPSDIESIEILKDASATAIYGSRGANGVVLITTKTGVEGKGVFQIDQDYSLGELPKYIDVMDANDYWLSRGEAQLNGGVVNLPRETLLDSARAGSIPNQNWQKLLYRTATTSNTNINFSGGNKDLRYTLTSNILNAKGLVKRTDYTRVSTRLNLDANISKGLKVGARLNYSSVSSSLQSTNTNWSSNNGTNSIIFRALFSNPSELLLQDGDNEEDGTTQITPLTFLENNTWDTNLGQFLGNMFVDLSLTKSLSFRSTFTYQNRNTKQRFYQNNLENLGIIVTNNRRGWAKTGDSQNISTTNTNQLNYKNKFGKHALNAVLGQSLEWRESEGLRTSNYGFPNDILTYYAPATATFQDPDIVSFRDSKLSSFFGRINYTFNNKWLLTVTGRYDGSSKFAKNNKWAFFPAAAIGYKLSQEKFIKDINAISNLKLRLSYGVTGNQAVSEYQSLSQLGSDQFVFGNEGESLSTIYFANQLPNANLKWETTKQFDAGLDLGLFKNRYTLTFDYYKKQTEDLLIAGNRIPSQSGFTGFTQNFGGIEADGLEFSVDARIINNDKMSWTLNANVSTGKAIVTDLISDNILSGYSQGWLSGGSQRLIIGEEIGTFFGHKTAGIAQFDDFVEFQGLSTEERINLYNQDRTASYTFVDGYEGGYPRILNSQRPGEQLYTDLDGDNQISEADKEIIGQAQPDLSIGINNSFSFGNIDLSFFFDGQFGQEVTNVTNWNLLMYGGGQQLTTVRQAWTPENPSDIYPRVDSSNEGAPSFIFSDRFIEDASFIRLQNITIGYTFPSQLMEKLKLSSLRLYASASNIFTISDYSGYNPDVSLTSRNNLSLGHDNAGYPIVRTIRMGVSIKL